MRRRVHTAGARGPYSTPISFKADKAGVFPITCSTHGPSMSAELIVLQKKR